MDLHLPDLIYFDGGMRQHFGDDLTLRFLAHYFNAADAAGAEVFAKCKALLPYETFLRP